jgi:hypothetical protein
MLLTSIIASFKEFPLGGTRLKILTQKSKVQYTPANLSSYWSSKIVLYTTLFVVKKFFTIRCPWKQIQVIFVVVRLLCDCRPVPQIILPLAVLGKLLLKSN